MSPLDQPLTWRRDDDRGWWRATAEGIGTYALYHFAKSEPMITLDDLTVRWVETRKWYAEFSSDGQCVILYSGHDLREARSVAEIHCAAKQRAERWRRYMIDNDPPAIDLSFTTEESREALSGAIDNPDAGAADPRDPATKHSRCRVCDGETQWGWCPRCQPVGYGRLP